MTGDSQKTCNEPCIVLSRVYTKSEIIVSQKINRIGEIFVFWIFHRRLSDWVIFRKRNFKDWLHYYHTVH